MAQSSTVGAYRIIKKLGSGNFGNAFICCKLNADSSKYVLKQINLDALNDHDKKGAIQEAELLRKLSSPCIVKYIDSFEGNGLLSIVMEYCDGGDLTTLIEMRKQLRQLFHENEIKNVLCQIAIALMHCHEQNIVHRDIKTSNIFLCKNGRVKLGDFGVSKVLKDSNSMAQTTIGTPYYLSPEICKGESYKYKSDIWALGCIAYEMLNFHRPFEAHGIARLVICITNSKFEPLSPKYSAELRYLVQSMLSKHPDGRPSSVEIVNHQSLNEAKTMFEPLIKSATLQLKNPSPFQDIMDMLDVELDQMEADHMKQLNEM